jgi:hypothetical protein
MEIVSKFLHPNFLSLGFTVNISPDNIWRKPEITMNEILKTNPFKDKLIGTGLCRRDY